MWGGSTSNCPAGACCARSADLLVAAHDARGVPHEADGAGLRRANCEIPLACRGIRRAERQDAAGRRCPNATRVLPRRNTRRSPREAKRLPAGARLAPDNGRSRKKAASGSGFPRGGALSSSRIGNRGFQPPVVTAGASVTSQLARGTLARSFGIDAANRRSGCAAAEAADSSHYDEYFIRIRDNDYFGIAGRRQGALPPAGFPSRALCPVWEQPVASYRAGASSSAAGGAASRFCLSPARGNSITFMLPRPQSS